MKDLISRQAAIDALDVLCQEHRYKIPGERETYSQYNEAWQDALDRAEAAVFSLPPAQQWIPFTKRALTAEEAKEHPEWCYIMDCPLPDDGQEILVSNGKWVWKDEFYVDDGCYLDSEYEIVEEATAWMPLPEPYKEEGKHE